MKKIVLIDDDYSTELLVEALVLRGHQAKRIKSAKEALELSDEVASADLLILDIIMERPEEMVGSTISGGTTTGVALLAKFRKQNPALNVLVYSGCTDSHIVEELRSRPHTSYLAKTGLYDRSEILRKVDSLLGTSGSEVGRKAFIVHGHDDITKLDLKNYLQNTLHWPEPIILHEQPNLGRTIIEKFEDHAAMADVVFVLLTPDDKGAPVAAPNNEKRRARQNVIFELGYFLGVFGRHSGQVFLLYKDDLELPSDLLGVIYIDISKGIAAAGEAIRKELEHGK